MRFEHVMDCVNTEIGFAAAKHGSQARLPWNRGLTRAYLRSRSGEALESAARARMRDGRADWAAILMEEVGEALQAKTRESLRRELVQVAATAVRIANLIDEGRLSDVQSAAEYYSGGVVE